MKTTRREILNHIAQATAVAALAPAFAAADAGLEAELDREEPTYADLRGRLARAIAEGTWRRVKPLVTECVRSGVGVAKIVADGAPIDERAFMLTTRILNDHHRIVRMRMVLTAKAHNRARWAARSGEEERA